MPRSRPQRPEHVPLRSAVVTSVESGSDGEWNVRRISGASATKTYRCPGCDQTIPVGVAHLVIWPADEYGSVDERRHWHAPCWASRAHRRPGRRRR